MASYRGLGNWNRVVGQVILCPAVYLEQRFAATGSMKIPTADTSSRNPDLDSRRGLRNCCSFPFCYTDFSDLATPTAHCIGQQLAPTGNDMNFLAIPTSQPTPSLLQQVAVAE